MRLKNQGFQLLVLILGLWLAFDLGCYFMAEKLWFQEVGYLSVFLLRLKTQLGVGAIATFSTAMFLLGNLALARRFKYAPEILESPQITLSNWKTTNAPQLADGNVAKKPNWGITWHWLLPAVGGLSLLVGLMLLHYGQLAINYWHPNWSFPTVTPALPASFQLSFSEQIWRHPLKLWQLGMLAGVLIALTINAEFWLTAIALAMSLFFGFVLSGHWTRFLQYFHPTPFNSVDPLFKQDISVYIFSLPVWQLLEFWLGGLCLYSLLAVLLVYLSSGNSLSQGQFPGFSPPQMRHLLGLSSAFMVAIAFRYWLARYQLLYSLRGVTYGASYTDVAVELPLKTGLSFLALAIALLLLGQTLFFRNKQPLKFLGISLGLYITCAVLGQGILPRVVQRLIVQPNELVRERPYIQRSIALTRQAFDLDAVEVQTFDPKGKLTNQDLQNNNLTINNIRLWDSRPLLQTNRQLQQIRLYYRFPDADIDRYTLKQASERQNQQVIIAARELDYSLVPSEAKTWINRHLIYTHGYGFTLSPVNTVVPGGLPDYFVKDIGTGISDTGRLQTSSQAIRESIPISRPRIYYGEITQNYVITSTKAKELDYPSGDENVYNTYDGNGGVAIGAKWHQILFAEYLKDWQMLLTNNLTSETKLLFRRNINQRIRAIAPFLRYDSDPYLVVANAGDAGCQVSQREASAKLQNNCADQNYLYWIVDAYTTSDRYPYSDPGKYEFNYIRNSVKVVIDAYHGSANFYVADLEDPIINSWTHIFPGLFKPLSALPASLRSHIRYPIDFFKAQSERLLSYHMTDPQVFYNREDQWRIPTEIYGNQPLSVEPYFLIMKLPTADLEEFVLLLPFTPSQRNNLIAWVAARSDGQNYGKLLLYQFPKQQLIYGPEQIEARINQDPVISQQISLWNRQGSRAIQGNLLVIPIERSLLYVEPLYLEAEQNSLPTLVRVIVAYENQIVMAETLNQALEAIFVPTNTAPAIVRPLSENTNSP
jgi:uncharacterized membrane protein (UPF0182 family)